MSKRLKQTNRKHEGLSAPLVAFGHSEGSPGRLQPQSFFNRAQTTTEALSAPSSRERSSLLLASRLSRKNSAGFSHGSRETSFAVGSCCTPVDTHQHSTNGASSWSQEPNTCILQVTHCAHEELLNPAIRGQKKNPENVKKPCGLQVATPRGSPSSEAPSRPRRCPTRPPPALRRRAPRTSPRRRGTAAKGSARSSPQCREVGGCSLRAR